MSETKDIMVMPVLNIEEALPKVNFDKAPFIAWANGIKAKFDKLAVREEDIKDTKQLLADLNKTAAAIDASRKEIKNRLETPIKAFEADMNEVKNIIIDTRTFLDEQVKRYVAQEREDKRALVQKMIDEACANYDNLTIPIQEQWLNKTTTTISIKKDLIAIAEKYEADEKAKAIAEQARQDRIAAIQTQVESLNAKHNLELALALFLSPANTDPATPLLEVQELIANTFEVEAKNREAEKARQVQSQPSAIPIPEKPLQVEPQPPQSDTEKWQILITLKSIAVPEMKKRLEVIKALGLEYEARRIG